MAIVSELTHSLTRLFCTALNVSSHFMTIKIGPLLLLLCLGQLSYAQSPVQNQPASVIHTTNQSLPSLIQGLLIAYSESLKSVTCLSATHGLFHWHKGKPSSWRLPSTRFTLESWRNLGTKDRRKIWQDRDFNNILNRPNFEDQFIQIYPIHTDLPHTLPVNFEPGRIRDEHFFKRLYGSNRAEVEASLTTIRWGTQTLKVTKRHQIHKRLQIIYSELRQLPKRFKKFYEPSAGSYHWRRIKGTTRLSVHSFGAAIDIGVKYSNYWRWTLKIYGRSKYGLIPYKNKFPKEIISIFERHGFIWGGWWYHHDTMHFEYRPELLIDIPKR